MQGSLTEIKDTLTARDSQGRPSRRPGVVGKEIAARLLTLQRPDETDSDFAKRAGLKPQNISAYKAGQYGVSAETALMVAKELRVNPKWLLTGEGPREPVEDGQNVFNAGVLHATAAVRRLLDELERAAGASAPRKSVPFHEPREAERRRAR